MARRGVNGQGTVFRRRDGRYEAAAYVLTTSGTRKRVRLYAKTSAEAHEKLVAILSKAQSGRPIADRRVKIGDYLDYWLEQCVKPNLRPKTYEQYEIAVRLYLKPGLGSLSIASLSAATPQAFLNEQ